MRQDTGVFDRRFAVGPACWDFFDLLWIHEGAVRLTVGARQTSVDISAPGGILISPGTSFHGKSVGVAAKASVLHFELLQSDNVEFVIAQATDAPHIQDLIRLSLRYASSDAAMDKRERLLQAILDCFSGLIEDVGGDGRIAMAWREAHEKLQHVRGIADVAAFCGLSESAFRALHREQLNVSAGSYLRELRLREAEQLLATTGLSLQELAQRVGYGYPESLSAAFSKSRGKTPGAYRKWCKRFA